MNYPGLILQPESDPTGQMTWAKGHYDSPYGRIESEWRIDGKHLSYTTSVPANTIAFAGLAGAYV